ncbi:hypothetical protein J6590_022324, partial [Homalodisca vitripennis]
PGRVGVVYDIGTVKSTVVRFQYSQVFVQRLTNPPAVCSRGANKIEALLCPAHNTSTPLNAGKEQIKARERATTPLSAATPPLCCYIPRDNYSSDFNTGSVTPRWVGVMSFVWDLRVDLPTSPTQNTEP